MIPPKNKDAFLTPAFRSLWWVEAGCIKRFSKTGRWNPKPVVKLVLPVLTAHLRVQHFAHLRVTLRRGRRHEGGFGFEHLQQVNADTTSVEDASLFIKSHKLTRGGAQLHMDLRFCQVIQEK